MPEMIRYLILNLVGLALAAFGVYAAIIHYPSSAQWAAWSNAMPALGAMLTFSVSIAAVIVGVAVLLLLLRRRRHNAHRRATFGAYDRVPPPRSLPDRHDDYAFEPDNHGHGGYEDHRGDVGRGYRDNGDYREFDERRRVSAFR